MTELEMLTLAAKAAGIVIVRSRLDDKLQRDMLVQNSARNPNQPTGPWNPREDDGDALRLAVRLDIEFQPGVEIVLARLSSSGRSVYKLPVWAVEAFESGSSDFKQAASRLAITRAAALIGKDMP